jgi:hypothetical protein
MSRSSFKRKLVDRASTLLAELPRSVAVDSPALNKHNYEHNVKHKQENQDRPLRHGHETSSHHHILSRSIFRRSITPQQRSITGVPIIFPKTKSARKYPVESEDQNTEHQFTTFSLLLITSKCWSVAPIAFIKYPKHVFPFTPVCTQHCISPVHSFVVSAPLVLPVLS